MKKQLDQGISDPNEKFKIDNERSQLVKELQALKQENTGKKRKPLDFHKITSDPMLKIFVKNSELEN